MKVALIAVGVLLLAGALAGGPAPKDRLGAAQRRERQAERRLDARDRAAFRASRDRFHAELRKAGALGVRVGSGRCRYRAAGALPDPSCTPGLYNPAVTQRTIRRTVCVAGWTRTVRPSTSVTAPLKHVLLAAYGQPDQPARYELDHLVPLELGGSLADPRNLWPEPRSGTAGALSKDGVENSLRARVCAGTMTLAAARRIMRTDWRRG